MCSIWSYLSDCKIAVEWEVLFLFNEGFYSKPVVDVIAKIARFRVLGISAIANCHSNVKNSKKTVLIVGYTYQPHIQLLLPHP